MAQKQVCCLALLILSAVSCQMVSRFEGPIQVTKTDAHPLRIIVPTQESNPEAQALILERARRHVRQSERAADILLTDTEALEQDLSGYNLIVYGTLQGNLWLRQYVTDLPVKLGIDRLITSTLHAGANLGFITSWPHPQAPQRGILIYTAFSPADVGSYGRPLPGQVDYLVTRDQTVIEADRYIKEKGRWSFPVWSLTPRQASADLKTLFKTIEAVHPDPLAEWRASTYEQFKAITDVQIRRLETGDRIIPKAGFAQMIARACAGYQDGHTRMSLDPTLVDTSNLTRCMLPFRLEYRTGQFYIGQSVDLLTQLRGFKIVAINGKPLIDQLQPTLLALSGKRQALRIARLMEEQRRFWGLFHPLGEDLVDLQVEDPNGEIQSYVIDLMSVMDYDALLTPVSDTRRDELRFYHDGRVCHWQNNQPWDSGRDQRWLEQVFKRLKQRGTTHLILDLRANQEAGILGAKSLLGYLLDKPYRLHAQIDTKISKALQAEREDLPTGAVVDTVIKEVCEQELPSIRETHFSGELFVLIGPGTFGGAADLATVIKDYQLGTLIGEETGGTRESFARSLSLSLPHSGLVYQVATTKTYPPLPLPGDTKQGTAPDIEVTPSLLTPYQLEPDPLLAFVLETVRKRLSDK